MIKKEDIDRLAGLARITLSSEEEKSLPQEIDSILDYVSAIEKVGGKSTQLPLGEIHNIMREDGEPHKGGIFTEALLDKVPQREGNYVKVKPIL